MPTVLPRRQTTWQVRPVRASRENASRQATVHDNLGNFLLEQKQLDRAIEQFQEAVALDSNETEHIHLANALFRKGRVGEAISSERVGARLRPMQAPRVRLHDIARGDLALADRAGELGGAVAGRFHDAALWRFAARRGAAPRG